MKNILINNQMILNYYINSLKNKNTFNIKIIKTQVLVECLNNFKYDNLYLNQYIGLLK